MSLNLRELYQDVILDHGKRPRNRREMEAPCSRAEGFNPLCGDRATVYVRLDGEVLADVSFVGQGCSISTASASLMSEALRGRTRAEAEKKEEERRGKVRRFWIAGVLELIADAFVAGTENVLSAARAASASRLKGGGNTGWLTRRACRLRW